MLLKKLDIRRGLCNGTRLIVITLHHRAIDAEISTGQCKGNRVLIPKTSVQFMLQRIQFLRHLSYSMTINKAQGQTSMIVQLMQIDADLPM